MSVDEQITARGSIWSTGTPVPTTPALPVRLARAGAAIDAGGPGGDDDVVPAPDEPGEISTDPEPDALALGWVVPPGAGRVDAIFVLAGRSLGIGRTERVTSPVWLDLDQLVTLDAIGEPVDGLTTVEIVMEDHRTIGAGWTDDFCEAVVNALQGTRPAPADQGPDITHAAAAPAAAPYASPQPAPMAATPPPPPVDPSHAAGSSIDAAPIPGATGAAWPIVPDSTEGTVAPGPDVQFDVVDTVASAPEGRSASLELEDVVYLGGYPGQSKRRKRCTVAMSRSGVELAGPGELRIRISWDVVRTVEVQNSDEARFRMNTKIHRDASALVLECDQGVTILMEARDCPTIALRSAISQLLGDLPVVVV